MTNPMSQLLELRSFKRRFEKNHPKFFPFLRAASQKALEEGSVVEITVTSPSGESVSSNIRITASDVEMFRKFEEMTQNSGF